MEKDLKFLENCPNEQLIVLADILAFDPHDNKTRITETLTKTKEWNLYYPNNIKGILSKMENELLAYASNPIKNVFMGSHITYREMLCDVCTKCGVKFNDIMSTRVIENCLLQNNFINFINSANESELQKACNEIYDLNIPKEYNGEVAKYLKLRVSDMDTAIIDKMCRGLALSIANKWEKNKIDLFQAFLHSLGLYLPTPIIDWNKFLIIIQEAFNAIVNIVGKDYRITIPATLYIASLRRINKK